MAAEIKRLMEGKWVVHKMSGFGKYLEALGMGAVKRKIATSVNPKLKIMVTDDIIKASLSVGPKKNKAVFRLGERYEVEANDVPSTAVSSWSNGKLKAVITPKDSSKKVQIVEREIIDGQMIQITKVKLVIKRQPKGLRPTNPDIINAQQYEPPRGKTNNLVSDQVQHKPACTVTEDGLTLEILELSRGGIVLYE